MTKQPKWKVHGYNVTEIVAVKMYVPDDMVAWVQENWGRPISSRKARQMLAENYLHNGGPLSFGDHQLTYAIEDGDPPHLTTADPRPDPWSNQDYLSVWPEQVPILIEVAGGHYL